MSSLIGGAELQRYRADIDGLRAVAVLAVVVFHLHEPWLPAGFVGVDIFFVISGYVVTGALARRPPGEAVGSMLIRFYSRRLRRLFPALIVCLALTSLVVALVIPPSQQRDIYVAGGAAAFGFSNIAFTQASRSYFALVEGLNPFLHTWSLGVEEQFYLIYPIVFLLAWRAHRRRSPSGFLILIPLAIASLALMMTLTESEPSLAFYLMPTRLWELLAGGLLYISLSRWSPRKGFILLTAQVLAVAILVLTIFSDPAAQDIPFPAVLPAVVGTCLLIATAETQSSVLTSLLSSRSMVYIGRISYSLYLYHWPVFTMFRWTIGLETPTQQILALVVSVALALISYHFVEVPVRAWQPSRDRVVFVVALSAVAAFALTIWTLSGPAQASAYIGQRTAPSNWLASAECHLPDGPDPISSCLTSKAAASPTIYIMGDSHAGGLVPTFEAYATQYDAETLFLTDNALTLDLLGIDGCGRTQCAADELGARLDFLSSTLGENDLVVFSMDRKRLLTLDGMSLGEAAEEPLVSSRAQVLQLALERLATEVDKTGAQLILVDDIPFIDRRYGPCVSGFVPESACRVTITESLQHRAPLTEVLTAVAGSTAAVYWDPHDLLCEPTFCSYLREGEVLYADASPHLLREPAAMLAAALDNAIGSP